MCSQCTCKSNARITLRLIVTGKVTFKIFSFLVSFIELWLLVHFTVPQHNFEILLTVCMCLRKG